MFGWKKKEKSFDSNFQTAVSERSMDDFSYFGGGQCCERQLYRNLKENVPVIDAAINKIVRLVGGFEIDCEDKALKQELNDFLKTVRVGGCGKGIEVFLSEHLEQLLTYGTAVGEIVVSYDCKRIAGLYNASLDDVELSVGKSPFELRIDTLDPNGKKKPIPYPELIVCSAIMPEGGSIYGTSVLRGLPFVSDVLMKIFRATGMNWERLGNVRFAVSYKPNDNERGFSKERAKQIAQEWSKAMKSREPRDFVTVGDVSIKVIGAESVIPDSQVSVRQMLEQIVAKLSIPPFMLGLSWSSTERMSSQQADILTSELEYYRRVLESSIRQICDMYLKLSGVRERYDIRWDNINLQDEVELARARLLNAQAEKLEKQNEME